MFGVVDKIKLFNWLRSWHHPKNPSSSNTGNGGDVATQGEHIARKSIIRYRGKGWISHWNPLQLEKRSCAQAKDVYTEDYRQQQAMRSQLASASDLVQLSSVSSNHKNPRSSSLDLDHKNKDNPSTAILLGHQHQQQLLALKAMGGDLMTREGATIEHDTGMALPAAAGVEFQQHKAGLKNRVLPLLTQEAAVETTSLPLQRQEDAMVGKPEACKRTGTRSLKKLTFAKSSSPESPRSPREIKWKKLLSYSRSGSPKSPSCFEWNNQQVDRHMVGHTGSFSTMGSPWNSQAGHRYHGNRRSSFKGMYKQGHWITTDSEFVVLEL